MNTELIVKEVLEEIISKIEVNEALNKLKKIVIFTQSSFSLDDIEIVYNKKETKKEKWKKLIIEYENKFLYSLKKIDKKIVKLSDRLNIKEILYTNQKYKDRGKREIFRKKYFILKNFIEKNLNQDDILCLNISIKDNGKIILSIIENDFNFINKCINIIPYFENYKFLSNKKGLYALELINKNFYIGSSRDIYLRFISHWLEIGACFTRLYKPIKILEFHLHNTNLWLLENKLTQEYLIKYDKYTVKGGKYV